MTETTATAATTTVVIKNMAYIAAFFIGLDVTNYTILAVFMGLDLVFGTVRAGVVHGWREVKSYKFISGIVSKLVVLSVPLIVVWAGKGIGIDLLFLARGALGMLILGEAYSVLGNVNSIYQKKDLPEFDIIATILYAVQKFFEKLFVTNRDKL